MLEINLQKEKNDYNIFETIMFFDTHCHLNFSRFRKNVDEVIARAQEAGVTQILIPGTDLSTSEKAIELVQRHSGFYAAVGIHPHHVFELRIRQQESSEDFSADVVWQEDLARIEELLSHPQVVAVGEVGVDRHMYHKTKYAEYNVDDAFIQLQKKVLAAQIHLAIQHDKSLILHNREATEDLLDVLDNCWDASLQGRTVFHCCEADMHLLTFAQQYGVFIGVDGDVTYDTAKQDFVREVPLELLVLETDAPFILPEPLRTQRKFPNEPVYLPLIAARVAKVKGIDLQECIHTTTENAHRLFGLS